MFFASIIYIKFKIELDNQERVFILVITKLKKDSKVNNMKHRSPCPIVFALDIIGDKWSLVILRDIILFGKTFYKDFLNSSEKIATNILANRLVLLESEGIINKLNDPENQKRYIYSPTKKGLDLIPLLIEMVLWSATHDPDTGAPKEKVKYIRNNKKEFEKTLREKFKDI